MIEITEFLYGRVHVVCICENPENVLNLLRANDISVFGITKSERGRINFKIYPKDELKAVSLIKSKNVSYKISKRSGLPVIFEKYKRRAGLYAGALFAAALISVSSLFIWEIRVEGNKEVSENDIKRTLETLGVAEGKIKQKGALERIYNDFLIAEDRISWISVNFDGNVAHVEVDEAQKAHFSTDKSKNYNIVAKCDGIIFRVDAVDGKSEVNKNDVVSKGDLLISSFVDSRKNGKIMRSARGFVWATTVHNYTVNIPKTRYNKYYTGKKTSGLYMEILGKTFPLKPAFTNMKNYERTKTKTRAVLFGFVRLPFYIIKEEYREDGFEKETVSCEKAYQDAAYEIAKRAETELADAEIIERKSGSDEKDDVYVFRFEFFCIENIAKPIEFIIEPDALQN